MISGSDYTQKNTSINNIPRDPKINKDNQIIKDIQSNVTSIITVLREPTNFRKDILQSLNANERRIVKQILNKDILNLEGMQKDISLYIPKNTQLESLAKTVE